jgi:RNA polymerase sigma-70 factor (ECF subfamily)
MDKVKLTQIVKEVQKDIGQFELLYSLIVNKVYYWCYMVIGNEADAVDASQEAMIRIYNKLHTLTNPETFSSWMYILVRNSCYRYLHNHKKKDMEFLENSDFSRKFEDTIIEKRSDAIPSKAYEEKEIRELIIGFINNLPRKQREVIMLHYLEELKIDEIAELLDYKKGSVKSRLHAGRKNLEKQIGEYQEENDVKLYGFAWLPLLGLFIKEHMDELSKKYNFQYDENLYVNNEEKSLKGRKLLNAKLIIVVSVLVIIAIILNMNLFSSKDTIQNERASISTKDNQDMYEKLKGHPYIETIIYSTFPTRTTVDITIELKQDIEKKDMKIMLNKNELSFEKKKNVITVTAEENGEYLIIINDMKTSFEIDRIDEYAPELIGVVNYGNYLQLIVNDELSQIEYEESYVEYLGESYEVTKDLKVYGEFEGYGEIIIFNKEGYYAKYDSKLD